MSEKHELKVLLCKMFCFDLLNPWRIRSFRWYIRVLRWISFRSIYSMLVSRNFYVASPPDSTKKTVETTVFHVREQCLCFWFSARVLDCSACNLFVCSSILAVDILENPFDLILPCQTLRFTLKTRLQPSFPLFDSWPSTIPINFS